jgi:hypothetical protein
MYPLTLLWHWGAQALPKGELDENGDTLIGDGADPATTH